MDQLWRKLGTPLFLHTQISTSLTLFDLAVEEFRVDLSRRYDPTYPFGREMASALVQQACTVSIASSLRGPWLAAPVSCFSVAFAFPTLTCLFAVFHCLQGPDTDF